jgi:hypothetical protein
MNKNDFIQVDYIVAAQQMPEKVLFQLFEWMQWPSFSLSVLLCSPQDTVGKQMQHVLKGLIADVPPVLPVAQSEQELPQCDVL